jgi:hypothetical protein
MHARAAGAEPVRGTWQQLVNCAFTHYDPTTRAMGCEGSTLWSGTWNGITHYHVEGTYDPLTGDSSGTLHETFYGADRGGRHGTMTFTERYTLVGATSTIHIDTRMTDATGGFAGARGALSFDGTDNILTGRGTYSGEWTPPPTTRADGPRGQDDRPRARA